MPLQDIPDQLIDDVIETHRIADIVNHINVTTPHAVVDIGYWEVIQRLRAQAKDYYYRMVLSVLPSDIAASWPTPAQAEELLEITAPDFRLLALPGGGFNRHLGTIQHERLGPIVSALADAGIVTIHQLAMTPVDVIYNHTEKMLARFDFAPRADLFRRLIQSVQTYIELYNELEHFIPADIRTELNPVTE